MKKSQLVGFLLTLLLGPLGLFYSSIAAALALLLLTFGAAFATTFIGGLGALVAWPLSILVGFATVSRYNSRVALEERRHREVVRAAGGGTRRASTRRGDE